LGSCEGWHFTGRRGYISYSRLATGYCELVKVYVTDAARRRGIGKKLIDTCMQRARHLGYTHVYLETLPELRMVSALYEKLGFSYIDKALGNSGHTDCNIWMIKELV
jgi:putative acetyltransferase